jgi:predicted glutamine amidotransferase
MCKLFAMTNVSDIKISEKLLYTIRNAVCKHNDKDGFGYVVNTIDGQIWGQKVVNPFKFRPLDTGKTTTQRLPIVSVTSQESFGPVSHKDNVSLMAHGRMSTNTININNTHPFLNDDVALCHNGVVSDPYKTVDKATLKTDCDTELLLRMWETGGVNDIQDNASGYYAVIVLDKLSQLHLIRDDRATLFIAWSDTAKSFLIATTVEIIEDIAKTMGWTIEAPESVLDNVYAVFSGNSVTYTGAIEPLGYLSEPSAKGSTDNYLYRDYQDFRDEREKYLYADTEEQLNDDDMPDEEDAIDPDDITEMLKRKLA